MTPFDRSKFARIAAWQLFTGHADAQVEAYLHSVGSGLTQAEVDRAISEGMQGLGLAALLNNPANLGAGKLFATVNGQPVTEYTAVVRYQTGGDVAEDWRTVTVDIAAGQSFAAAMAYVEAAIARQRESKGYGRYSPGGSPQAPEFVFAVPVFTAG